MADGDALPGDFSINGKQFSFALERASKAIPAGRYRVLFTVSDRASIGQLWSPDPEHRLPLVDGVPGRSGIRIHAANEYDELEGCVALGRRRAGPMLVNSRAAVTPFVDLVRETIDTEEIWLTVLDAPKGPQPLNT